MLWWGGCIFPTGDFMRLRRVTRRTSTSAPLGPPKRLQSEEKEDSRPAGRYWPCTLLELPYRLARSGPRLRQERRKSAILRVTNDAICFSNQLAGKGQTQRYVSFDGVPSDLQQIAQSRRRCEGGTDRRGCGACLAALWSRRSLPHQ